jgi:two-component system cell cycle response regulator DivK
MDLNDVSTWSVLIVDDEPDNLEVVADTLEFYGASGRTATNGEEGLLVLESFMPDFILLDLSMPQMNGWEMRKRVKSNPQTQHLLVIALTAHAMAGDAERALEVGFDGYITKPVEIASLIDDLRGILRAHFQQAVEQYKKDGTGKEEVKP